MVAVAKRAAGHTGVRAITVDGPAFHNLGANASWELGASIAAGVNYLRVLTESGLTIAAALRQISFRFAADDDQFMTIAKFRAARTVWARVAEVVGEPDAGAAVVHAETSLPMMTQRDPWVNMLRCTLAAFGAGVGGADSLLVFPFDVAIDGGFPGTATSFARRIARNTQLLLLEESHVGRVLDPAAGSWFVEDLTQRLAEQAWQHFQAIEARGDSPRPAISSPARSPRSPPAAATTSRIGGPRSPASTNSPTSPNRRCRTAIRRIRRSRQAS